MTMYRVTWEIDIDADSLEDAAEQAREIQLDRDSIATVFDVTGPDGHKITVDLNTDPEEI